MQIGKDKIKRPLFAGDTIFCIEYAKDPIKNLR